MENISCLVLTDKHKPELVTQEELKEVLQNNDGDLKRLADFEPYKLRWGYLCKISDYFQYYLMDMDKVILLIGEYGEVYNYEHSGNYNPEHKDQLKVIGFMDENSEIETTEKDFLGYATREKGEAWKKFQEESKLK